MIFSLIATIPPIPIAKAKTAEMKITAVNAEWTYKDSNRDVQSIRPQIEFSVQIRNRLFSIIFET